MAADTFDILRELVAQVTCKRGWSFRLVDEDGALRLVIRVIGLDARDPKFSLAVGHYFPVPTATYNMQTWRRWLFERCRGVENHELGEWFMVGNERPFAPLHSPGNDPYTVVEYRDEIEARTNQDGSINE